MSYVKHELKEFCKYVDEYSVIQIKENSLKEKIQLDVLSFSKVLLLFTQKNIQRLIIQR